MQVGREICCHQRIQSDQAKHRPKNTQKQSQTHGTDGPSNPKTETHKHKHKVEHMVHSTWQPGASVAEHVSDNIDQSRPHAGHVPSSSIRFGEDVFYSIMLRSGLLM